MRLRLLWCALACLTWSGSALAEPAVDIAAAEPAGQIETLEAAAAAHVAAFSALDTERTNLALNYRNLVETLTQRLKFGTTPKNPALLRDLAQAQTALAALGQSADKLAEIGADLTDDAAKANGLARSLRAALAAPGADPAALQPLADRVAAATDTLDRALGQALEQRRRQAEMAKPEAQTLASLAQAIDTGHVPSDGIADPTIAEMLAPPSLMAPPTRSAGAETETGEPPIERARAPGRWAVQFGLFPTEDDAGYVMARLSLRGIQSRFTAAKDKHDHTLFKVLTRGFATRAAAQAAAAELSKDDLHPSGVVELPDR